MHSEIISKKTIVYRCLQCSIDQNLNEFEILLHHMQVEWPSGWDSLRRVMKLSLIECGKTPDRRVRSDSGWVTSEAWHGNSPHRPLEGTWNRGLMPHHGMRSGPKWALSSYKAWQAHSKQIATAVRSDGLKYELWSDFKRYQKFRNSPTVELWICSLSFFEAFNLKK